MKQHRRNAGMGVHPPDDEFFLHFQTRAHYSGAILGWSLASARKAKYSILPQMYLENVQVYKYYSPSLNPVLRQSTTTPCTPNCLPSQVCRVHKRCRDSVVNCGDPYSFFWLRDLSKTEHILILTEGQRQRFLLYDSISLFRHTLQTLGLPPPPPKFLLRHRDRATLTIKQEQRFILLTQCLRVHFLQRSRKKLSFAVVLQALKCFNLKR